MSVVKGNNPTPNLKISFRKDISISEYIPLPPNPGEPNPVIPVTGVGDMFRAVYDKDNNNVVDRVDAVEINEVAGLRDILNDLANQTGTGGGGKEIITVTNNGSTTFLPGSPVAWTGTQYMLGTSVAPRHKIIGLATEYAAPGDAFKVQLSGFLILPTENWDAVTGTVGGLGHSGNYFVNISSQLTLNPPTSTPEYLIKIGQAISPTTLLIDLDMLIKL